MHAAAAGRAETSSICEEIKCTATQSATCTKARVKTTTINCRIRWRESAESVRITNRKEYSMLVPAEKSVRGMRMGHRGPRMRYTTVDDRTRKEKNLTKSCEEKRDKISK